MYASDTCVCICLCTYIYMVWYMPYTYIDVCVYTYAHNYVCVYIYIYNMYKHMGFTKMKSCQTYPTSFFSKRIEISQKKGKRMELVHLRFSKM